MALVRWNPSGRNVTTRNDVRDDIECFLEDYVSGYNRPWNGRWQTQSRGYTPRVDLLDNEKEFVLKAELPGIDKEDLDITVTHDVVTIKGERKIEEVSENECYFCRESSAGALPKAKPRSQVKITVN